MKISVIGAGYVGLVTGVCLADKGHTVVCVDLNAQIVAKINGAQPSIHEAGLAELLERNVPARMTATTDIAAAVADSDVTFIAVGTPFKDGAIDLAYVKAATRQVGLVLKDKPGYHVVVVKSTVVPGTTDGVVRPLLEEASGKSAGRDFGVAMNPEFLTEGVAVRDFMSPDRLVIGGMDDHSRTLVESLYDMFPDVPRVRCNTTTAEMIKYTSNALLATLISFSNEIGNLCASLGDVDAAEVMPAIHNNCYLTVQGPGGTRTPAPITSFLEAGCGFGGSCLPKDVKALIAHAERIGRGMPVLSAVMRTNEGQAGEVLRLLKKHFPSLEGVRVTLLGLAFKPDTSDMRESPAITIATALIAEGARVAGHDPVAVEEARQALGPSVDVRDELPAALADAQAVVVVTRWDAYRDLPRLIQGRTPSLLVVDGRRIVDKAAVSRYEGIGL